MPITVAEVIKSVQEATCKPKPKAAKEGKSKDAGSGSGRGRKVQIKPEVLKSAYAKLRQFQYSLLEACAGKSQAYLLPQELKQLTIDSGVYDANNSNKMKMIAALMKPDALMKVKSSAAAAAAAELRSALGKRKLSTTGLKSELEARLEAAKATEELETVQLEAKRCKNVMNSLADEYICPITQELPLEPVIAEDGKVYEKGAIEEWLRKQKRSPITSLPMGTRLMPATQARNIIEQLVQSGAIEGKKAASWKKKLNGEKKLKQLREKAEAVEDKKAKKAEMENKELFQSAFLKLEKFRFRLDDACLYKDTDGYLTLEELKQLAIRAKVHFAPKSSPLTLKKSLRDVNFEKLVRDDKRP